jgi:hypothetical protein
MITQMESVEPMMFALDRNDSQRLGWHLHLLSSVRHLLHLLLHVLQV